MGIACDELWLCAYDEVVSQELSSRTDGSLW